MKLRRLQWECRCMSRDENREAWTSRRKGEEAATQIGARQAKCLPAGTHDKELRELLDFDLSSSRFDLLLDLFGLLFGRTFLHGFWRAFDKSFRFCKPETRHSGADFLNDGDLLRSVDLLEDDIE